MDPITHVYLFPFSILESIPFLLFLIFPFLLISIHFYTLLFLLPPPPPTCSYSPSSNSTYLPHHSISLLHLDIFLHRDLYKRPNSRAGESITSNSSTTEKSPSPIPPVKIYTPFKIVSKMQIKSMPRKEPWKVLILMLYVPSPLSPFTPNSRHLIPSHPIPILSMKSHLAHSTLIFATIPSEMIPFELV
jgi:hypothetical protein